ncbi:MAG: aminoacyl-histidine dipeptidase [Clostridia bacterium]|nr:aminoacyl-histidine dipeptidase [Clostridia bacterium]
MRKFENHNYITKGLQPEKVFRYFEQLSQIPRGSHNEREVSNYLLHFGQSLGLETIQDDVLNIIIKKPGTAGYENAPTVILQGHMDMVCEKNADTEHDFTKDPLKLYLDGDLLKAHGTTLGADNGIAVAFAMAILDSNDIKHPPLEVIVTVEEETGMGGVIGFDKNNVSGKLLINIDSEEEGVFFASCAGGVRANLKLPVERKPVESKGYHLMIKDLKGGHSGLNIKDGRGNAIKLLGRLLNELEVSFDLAHIKGGSKPNAIPREADAVIVCGDEEKLRSEVERLKKIYNNELLQTDHLDIAIKEIAKVEFIYTEECKSQIISGLVMIPCGVQTMSFAIKDLVESSLNIGVLHEKDNKIVFESALRSSVRTLKYEMLERLQIMAKWMNCELETVADYPEWAYNPKSMLQDLFKKIYKDTTGKEGEIAAIHAGLECGFFAEKLTEVGDGSDLDMISFGPNMANVHTPYEQLSISSVTRTFEFLKQILAQIK